ncbi:hypothetical protein WA026_010253 [Henosepilachna vigintioctopunctata]|uniref:Uncharacterized protein n=1 Tax=Henosepilachna vigintioctopunctata TaxID=420089 RepID=A0AAW1UIP2_9CUCU
MSDSDSGIASPLSPLSLYGFLGYSDKDKEYCKSNEGNGKVESTRSNTEMPFCTLESVKVSFLFRFNFFRETNCFKRIAFVDLSNIWEGQRKIWRVKTD